MPKVRFSADFDWTDPRKPSVTVAYKKGMVTMVTTACADAAVAKGKAVKLGDDDERALAQAPTVAAKPD